MTDKMIVLADLGRVKAYRVTPNTLTSKPQIEMIYDCEFPDAHGASIRENHHIRVENERRLIHLVAEKISELVQGQHCWYMAAGEAINSRIVELLNPHARAVLYKNVSADLVKVPKQQLLEYFTATPVA